MIDTSAYFDLISGQRRGIWPATQRAALHLASGLYAGVLSLRNIYYDYINLPTALNLPVISLGNITVGGTGKTPMAIWMAQQLLQRGRRPAVLSRGYRSSEQTGPDEILLVTRRCPKAVAIAHPNRTAAGQLAIEEYGCDVLVLDDGFQHRRVWRDLDIVLVDATRPFGFDHVLPRGLLREPMRGLSRADVVVITRADQVHADTLEAIETTVGSYAPRAAIVPARHRPSGFTTLTGEPTDPPAGERIGAFAGIARPEAFADTLAGLSITPIAERWWPDHHAYTAEDVNRLGQWARDQQLTALVTTEKDAVKLAQLNVNWPVPVRVLGIEIAFSDEHAMIVGQNIDDTLEMFSASSDDIGDLRQNDDVV